MEAFFGNFQGNYNFERPKVCGLKNIRIEMGLKMSAWNLYFFFPCGRTF
ncbi:MAG: hypothetical protein ACTSQS_06280 [Promethearchaeota archaeon]